MGVFGGSMPRFQLVCDSCGLTVAHPTVDYEDQQFYCPHCLKPIKGKRWKFGKKQGS